MSQQKPLPIRIIIGFFSIFIIAGFVLLGFGVRNIWRAHAAENWPTTTGTIVSSEVKRNRSSETTTYGAAVVYDYEVGGREYVQSRITFGDSSRGDPAYAERIVRRYQPDREVTVYYDPEDPSLAVLEPSSGGSWLLLLIGGAFIVFSIFMMLMMSAFVRHSRPPKTAEQPDSTM